MDKKMEGTTSVLGKFGNEIGKIATGPLVAIGAAVGTAAGLIAGFKDVMDLGGELNDMSLATGESAGNLVILREAFKEAGLGADSLGGYLLKMQKALNGMNEDGEDASKVFDALGVSVTELKGLDAIGQIQALQRGFAGISDQAQRVQIARDLFGKGGGKALSLLGDPEVLNDARQRAGPLADVMEKNAAVFDHFGDEVGALKLDFEEFFSGALSEIAPELDKIIGGFESIDFVGIGEGFGSLLKPVLELAEGLAYVFLLLGKIAEKMSHLLGSDSKADAGFAAKYAGMTKVMKGDSDYGGTRALNDLQRAGLGVGLAGSGDQLLNEVQRLNAKMQKVVDNTTPRGGAGTIPGLPV